MGFVVSKPVNYVKNKAHETKQGIIKKVDDTKTAIFNKIFGICDGVYNKVNNTKDCIVNSVVDTKNAIFQKVYNVQTYVCSKCNAVVSAVVDAKNYVVDKVCQVCQTITNIGLAVHQKYTNVKDGVTSCAISAKNKVTGTYQTVRETYPKLNRKQKFGYGLLFLFFVICFFYTSLVLWDVYCGDYEAAGAKVGDVALLIRYIVSVLCDVLSGILNISSIAVAYLWQGTKLVSHHAWEGTKVCSAYTWEGVKTGSEHTWDGVQTVSGHAWYGVQVTSGYVGAGAKTSAAYCWKWLKVGAGYGWRGTLVVCDHICAGSILVAEYAHRGGVRTGQYLWQASKNCADYTKYAIKEGTLWTLDTTYNLLVTLLENSYHGTVYMLDGARVVTWGLLTGSTSLSQVLMDGSTILANKTYYGSIYAANKTFYGSIYAANKTYHGSIAFADFSQSSVITLYECSTATYEFVCKYGSMGSVGFYHGTIATVTAVSEGTVTTVTTLYNATVTTYTVVSEGTVLTVTTICDGTVATCTWLYTTICNFVFNTYTIIYTTCDFIINTTITTFVFLWEWSYFIVTEVAHKVYYFLENYGFRWLCAIAVKLSDWAFVLVNIFWKFFRDLSLYLGNFFYAFFYKIYSIVYVLVAFVLSIVGAVMSIIRLCVHGTVGCVTAVFRAIIWCCQEVMGGYMYALNKYNMYREILFVAFVVLMSAYCTGLVRDRVHCEEEEDEEEDEDIDDDIAPPEYSPLNKAPPQVMKQQSVDLPPIYEEHSELVSYDDEDSDLEFCPSGIPDAFDSSDDDDGHIAAPVGPINLSTVENVGPNTPTPPSSTTNKEIPPVISKSENKAPIINEQGDMSESPALCTQSEADVNLYPPLEYMRRLESSLPDNSDDSGLDCDNSTTADTSSTLDDSRSIFSDVHSVRHDSTSNLSDTHSVISDCHSELHTLQSSVTDTLSNQAYSPIDISELDGFDESEADSDLVDSTERTQSTPQCSLECDASGNPIT